jgi:hypothetical protein
MSILIHVKRKEFLKVAENFHIFQNAVEPVFLSWEETLIFVNLLIFERDWKLLLITFVEEPIEKTDRDRSQLRI